MHGLLSGPRPGTLDEPRPALQVPPHHLRHRPVRPARGLGTDCRGGEGTGGPASAGRAGEQEGWPRLGGWGDSPAGRHSVKPARATRCAEDSARGQEARSAAVVARDTTPGFRHRGTFLQLFPGPGRRGEGQQPGRGSWCGLAMSAQDAEQDTWPQQGPRSPSWPPREATAGPLPRGPKETRAGGGLPLRPRCWVGPLLSAHEASSPGPSGSQVTGTWAGL